MAVAKTADHDSDGPGPVSPDGLTLGSSVEQSLDRNADPADALREQFGMRMSMSQGLMENIIGGGFMLVIGIIMLGFLFDLDLVSNFSGPFADQLGTVETVLGAAIIFAVLGVLALAGVYAYSMFTR